jgi:ribA/ribD-fused uncharacterized protein
MFTPPITSFSGDHRFLSNFWPARVYQEYCVPGVNQPMTQFPTVEHAYQAAKCFWLADFYKIARAASPGIAKRMSRTVAIRADWDAVKLDIMRELLVQKFMTGVDAPELGAMLKATGDADLIEGNTWGDRFWGQSPVGKGENHLGRILVDIRSRL